MNAKVFRRVLSSWMSFSCREISKSIKRRFSSAVCTPLMGDIVIALGSLGRINASLKVGCEIRRALTALGMV